ncbi:MAG: hypothetical protein A3I88_03525 [Candidatus Portnoybacteria bacterium RIFCSPLOWO2_12_FULL_39_9]|uniref:Uncharacterized protein n=1 Tax=Candidatus Portnoybacteria bacterium RIFCSPHIGHO2_12_FULL_38_9 TaxID=1801997 RepID=A0A1G2FEZ2_9BACT|nr:MAG: hypothetical protein A2646_03240 [Candidatus Portnoybacteria bacterium RIFCSPHIGHO2_02_FULL_39_12]OGZ36644.1 MAG: hypothetical protein A3J64_00925 [Candidatus Portnoybacteria bacterium RIFCSPHIGHO2_12_FULL_38_9]OGZ40008.1 MAG: hypothetical protein A3I88_03525 [Candidatus Portnoybacteria bacterium RIFCSPLOWO2_12_FULL_39_9]
MFCLSFRASAPAGQRLRPPVKDFVLAKSGGAQADGGQEESREKQPTLALLYGILHFAPLEIKNF